MEEENLIATRESFGKALEEIDNEKVVVLDADVDSSTKTNLFKKKFPERFVECGISEANMLGVAAGIATTGKIPVASTFAVFATGRCYDQIRNSICYPNLNVKIVGTHAGITVGEDGATHQMLEDINLMRGLPNMCVLSTSDDTSTRELTKIMIEHEGPCYLRVSRRKTPIIYTDDTRFEIGKGIQIGEGKDGTIFATGDLVSEALKAQEALKSFDIDIRVCDMYSIKPIDKELIIKNAKETGILFSLEDHNIIGGLGTAISEVLCEEYPKKLTRLGINDTFGKSGLGDSLLKYYKLDANSIIEEVKSCFIA